MFEGHLLQAIKMGVGKNAGYERIELKICCLENNNLSQKLKSKQEFLEDNEHMIMILITLI